MGIAIGSESASLRREAKSIVSSYSALDIGRLASDSEIDLLLRRMTVSDIIDVVDELKTQDGDPRSILIYRAWISSTQFLDQTFAAWYNLGVHLNASGAIAEAAMAFKTALRLQANLGRAAVNAGLCHEEMKDVEEALRIWGVALQSDDDRTALLNHRGRVFEELKRYDEAEKSLRASLLTNPDQPDVVHHLIGIKTKVCSWPVFEPLPGLDASALIEGTSALSMLAVTDDVGIHERRNRSWMVRKFPPSMPRLSPIGGYAHRKLRIGYMSSDYCMHPMAYLVADLFEQHSRDDFTIYGYCSTKDDGSAVRRRVLASFDHVRPILDFSDEQAAHAIRSDEIDILVDLNGLTLGTRLPVLRWRPAPVQATYLGYNGTIPFEELDYILADRYVIPPETALSHKPKPLYVSSCYQANDRKLAIALPATRAEAGLPENVFVFCCFSNNYKITQEIFAAWLQILRRTEGSILWLYSDNDVSRRNMTMRFRDSGLAEDRLFFAARTSPEIYRGRLALADLFLDTFPYNAGTTASDALRVGLPLVTLSGRSFASRMAGSLLHAIDLADGVVETFDAYVERAVSIATNPALHRALRQKLGGDAWAKTIGDTPAFTRKYEAALRSVAVSNDIRNPPGGVTENPSAPANPMPLPEPARVSL